LRFPADQVHPVCQLALNNQRLFNYVLLRKLRSFPHVCEFLTAVVDKVLALHLYLVDSSKLVLSHTGMRVAPKRDVEVTVIAAAKDQLEPARSFTILWPVTTRDSRTIHTVDRRREHENTEVT
jgi:hypothetical protein